MHRNNNKNFKLRTLGTLGLVAASTLLASNAAAQEGADGSDWIDATGYDFVESVERLADGSVRIVFTDGETITLAAQNVAMQGDTILVSYEAFIDAADAVGAFGSGMSGGAALVAGGALVGGAGLALGGGGSDGGSAPNQPSNLAPVFGDGTGFSYAENATGPVGSVVATDADGDTLTYTLSGSDAALFDIDASSGEISFKSSPDFEVPQDADGNNIYDLIVTASDGTLSTSRNVSVEVTNENDVAPEFTSGTSGAVDENVTATNYVAAATDVDGDAVTYAITGGADASLFTIDAQTGEVSLIAAADAEAPNDSDGNGVYELEITATDGVNSTAQTVAITLNNVNEAPNYTGSVTETFDENTTNIGYTATAIDPEGAAVSFSLGASGDSGLFSIDASTGALTLNAAQNFELPGDANGDGAYDVEIIATDAAGNATSTVVVFSIADVNEAPSIMTVQTVVDEEQTSAGRIMAEDPEGGALSYAITGGTDSARLQIDQQTGAMTFVTAPDAENFDDANGDGSYQIEVMVTDPSGLSETRSVVVIVQDTNDNAPVISSAAAASFDENDTGVVLDVDASDADASSTIEYTIVGGADASDFTIDQATGELRFVTPPDYEAFADANGDSVYEVTVEASDGDNAVTQDVSITVNDRINEFPPVVTSPNTFAVDEDESGGQSVGIVTATDSDPGNGGFSFAISGGADAALFTIDTATGELSFTGGTDFENRTDSDGDSVYEVTVSVADIPAMGTPRTTTQDISVTVQNIDDEAPEFASPTASVTAAENGTSTGYIASATNTDGSSAVVYAKDGGADENLFAVDANTGALTFLSPQDFENFGDQNGDGIYEVIISATDASGESSSQTVTVNLANENDSFPQFTSPSSASFAENGTGTVLQATASDADMLGPLTFRIVGGTDENALSIDPQTGAITFDAIPDFDNPADSDGDNQYVVLLEVSDGVQTSQQTATITVTDVNDTAPVITSAATASVNENNDDAFLTVQSTDEDTVGPAPTYAITGGADGGRFDIDSATGELSFKTGADYEAFDDANGDSVFEVEVTASDGVNTSPPQLISVTLNDVDPEGIVLSQLGANGFIISSGTVGSSLALTGLGDFDGDGFDDLLLSDVFLDIGGGNDNGEAGIVSGETGPKGTSNGNFFTYDVSSDTVIGGNSDDELGAFNTAAIGDINGDGITDFALTAAFSSSQHDLYIWTGGSASLPTTATNIDALFSSIPSSDGFVIRDARIEAWDFDYDGDGIDDLILEAGTQSKLLFGSDSFALTQPGPSQPFELDVSGAANIGSVISKQNLGDLDGDGFDEFGVLTGTDAFIWYGQDQASAPSSFTAANSDRQLSNLYTNGVLVDLGDINADGYDDFAVYDPNVGIAGQAGGEVSVFLGGPGRTNATLADADFTITPSGNIKLYSADGVGDIDGDGFDDFAISFQGPNGVEEIGLIYGAATQASITTDDVLRVYWDDNGTVPTELGYGRTGDINGDGIDDLAGFLGTAATPLAGDGVGFVAFGQAAAQTAVTASATSSADNVLVGSSQDDFLDTSAGGDDVLIGGGGDDFLVIAEGFTNSTVTVTAGTLTDTENGFARLEGGAGQDTFASSRPVNLTDATVSGTLTSLTYSVDPSAISFDSVERVEGGNIFIIDASSVELMIGQNINGARTLVVEATTLILADASDWTPNGQTNYDGSTYNVFVHTDGAQIFSLAGDPVYDTAGNDLRAPNQSLAPGGPMASAFFSSGSQDGVNTVALSDNDEGQLSGMNGWAPQDFGVDENGSQFLMESFYQGGPEKVILPEMESWQLQDMPLDTLQNDWA